jgi:elongation factor Ts
MAVDAKEVKRLRDETGAGFMDCKRALEESGGDLERAKEILRTRGLASARKLSERPSNEGLVEAYLHQPDPGMPPRVGVLVELNCGTDFVAKTPAFRQLARDIALHIAAARPDYLSRDDVPPETIEREREIAARQAEGKPPHVVERIVEGKLNEWYAERVLLDQVFVRDEGRRRTIQELLDAASAEFGEPVRVRRFARFRVGGDS